MRLVRGVLSGVNQIVRSSTTMMNAYGKNKQRVIMSGIMVGTAVAGLALKVVPPLARGVGRGVKKLSRGKRSGRAATLPKSKQGTMQETVRKQPEEVAKVKPLSKRQVRKMNQAIENGEDAFSQTRNSSTLTAEEVKRRYKPVEGEALRIQEQVIEACKRYNVMTNTLKATYELEPPLKRRLWIHVEGKVLKVSEKGIYSMMDNPYYIHGKMDKSDALARLLVDFSYRQVNLFAYMLMVYDQTIFEVQDEEEVTREKVVPIRKKEVKEPKELDSLGFSG